jgi:hypothetical protein
MASQILLIARIAAAGSSFSPLPCKAWHGYMVTIAHRVEEEVGADGHASPPPCGTATVAPPANVADCYIMSAPRVLGLRMGRASHAHNQVSAIQ